ncbi:MAG TPA: type VI secretion system baseplate subunit TssK [Longimicrobiales bacterium]|nr:type VI secretion system baseplate subunit TssK [Longimicrobiales bacterium]
MRTLSPVVWSEGMHLAQHHFQHQNRYFEDATSFALTTLFFEPWGLASCELDEEALLNGTVAVPNARGVMPDGLPFHFPEDPSPEPLQIRERFSPTSDAHLVLLGIPRFRPEGANCVEDGEAGDSARFRSTPRPVMDETTGHDEKEVAVAGKNFRLLLDVEVPEELVTLPLARVRRDGAGHFVYDAEYIPPCLQIRASPGLLDLLRRQVEILDSKAEALARERAGEEGATSDYASREVVGYWLSHAVHAALPGLRHHLGTRTAHPEALYREMSRLAGALCTFTAGAHPRDLPAYEHADLERTFRELDHHIRRNLDVVLPTSGVRIPLQTMEPYFHSGKVVDRRCLAPGAEWYLAVRPTKADPSVVEKVPRVVKLCSAKHIVRLVREAYPGLELSHVPSPPSAISPRVGSRYFRIGRTDPCWRSVTDTGEVGLYVPAAVADAEFELVVLVEE